MNPNNAVAFGRYYEDFAAGAVYRHSVRKTITESDNNLFCLLVMAWSVVNPRLRMNPREKNIYSG